MTDHPSRPAQLLPMSVIDALRDSPCPRPFNGRPDDLKSGACYDSGECGCQNGVALKAAALAAPLQDGTDAARIRELEAFVSWVETWTANPISAYSVFALDGMFGMTRDKIAALRAKA